jgi:predicted outer membrane repeat protein
MHLKLLRTAATVAVLGGTVTLGLGSTQAALAQTTVHVGCGVDATANLVTAMDTAQTHNDTVLILQQNCTYEPAAGLPPVKNELTIVGQHDSSIAPTSYENLSIFTVTATGDLTLNNVNVAKGGGSTATAGGAVYIEAAGSATIHGGTFSDNTVDTDGGDGGAIANYGSLTVDGAAFLDNDASNGGAIYNFTGGSLTLNGDSFTGNETVDGDGGAVYNAGTMTVGFTTLNDNTAEYGGAVYVNTTGSTHISDSMFTHNTANADGGGIDDEAGTAVLSHVTFYDNDPDNCIGDISCTTP